MAYLQGFLGFSPIFFQSPTIGFMKKIALTSFLFVTFSSLASSPSDLTLGHTYGNDLIIRSKSCDTLVDEHIKICEWKKNLEPSFEIPKIERTQCRGNSNQYTMTVSECLPKFVKENQNKELYQSGANCWGTAMSFKGLSETPRFVWSDEITYWLNSPICRKLEPGEEKKPGDILNIFGPEYVFKDRDEKKEKGYLFWEALNPQYLTESPVSVGYSGYHNFLHSETYISDNIVFGKESPSYQDRFEFSLMKDVYGRSNDDECQENQAISANLRENQNESRDIKGNRCDYFSNVYRCGNVNDFFTSANLTETEKGIWEEVNTLRKMQNRLFPILQERKVSLAQLEQQELLNYADRSAQVALNQLSKQSFSKNTEMLLALQYFTAQGIRKSMELARMIPATEAL